MIGQLARLDVRDLAGVFAARQLGRGLAASLTLEQQDQIRVATALSEIGRSAVTGGLTAVIAFGVDDTDLLLTVTLDGEPPANGVAAAARLMDEVAADGRVVRMTKRRPPGVSPDMELIRAQLAALRPESALDELRRQNADLISALDDLKRAERPAGPAQLRAAGDQSRGHGPVHRAVERTRADQPRRGGPVRRA